MTICCTPFTWRVCDEYHAVISQQLGSAWTLRTKDKKKKNRRNYFTQTFLYEMYNCT